MDKWVKQGLKGPLLGRQVKNFHLAKLLDGPFQIFIMVFIFAFLACAAVAAIRGVGAPSAPDEFSYLLAARTFASGHLTNPTPEGWQARLPMHWIFVPTYMSKYPPAQGLFLALGIILGHPILGVWIGFALMVAAISWLLLPFVGKNYALIGSTLAILNPTLGAWSYWAQSYWGGAVAAAGGAILIGAINRRFNLGIALLATAGLGILANSRPYEGLALSLAVTLVMLYRRRTKDVLLIASLFVPVAFLMGFYNYSVTRNPLKMPYQVYAEQYDIAPKFIFLPSNSPTQRMDPREHSDEKLYRVERTFVGFLMKNVMNVSWWIIVSFNVLLIPIVFSRRRLDPRSLFLYGSVLCASMLTVPIMLHYFAPIYPLNFVFAMGGDSPFVGRT